MVTLFVTTAVAQPPPEMEIFSDELSEVYLDRLEQWQYYFAHPIDLSTASLTLLRTLSFL